MTSRAEKLLNGMRRSRSGWGQKDFERLLEGYDFEKKGHGKHQKYYHPEFPDLWISIPRHHKLKEWVAEDAVKLIDELIQRKKSKEKRND
ncbi:MAG: type II toxin-antitoxin system HicA family toxin [Bacteroidota bacterium]